MRQLIGAALPLPARVHSAPSRFNHQVYSYLQRVMSVMNQHMSMNAFPLRGLSLINGRHHACLTHSLNAAFAGKFAGRAGQQRRTVPEALLLGEAGGVGVVHVAAVHLVNAVVVRVAVHAAGRPLRCVHGQRVRLTPVISLRRELGTFSVCPHVEIRGTGIANPVSRQSLA